jgi:hypothetical protein
MLKRLRQFLSHGEAEHVAFKPRRDRNAHSVLEKATPTSFNKISSSTFEANPESSIRSANGADAYVVGVEEETGMLAEEVFRHTPRRRLSWAHRRS